MKPLGFYFTTSQHGSIGFIFSKPDKAECFVWFFKKATVRAVKTSLPFSDEVVSEECLFYKFTEETGLKARSSHAMLVSVFRQRMEFGVLNV